MAAIVMGHHQEAIGNISVFDLKTNVMCDLTELLVFCVRSLMANLVIRMDRAHHRVVDHRHHRTPAMDQSIAADIRPNQIPFHIR